jgi:hypothetical protein
MKKAFTLDTSVGVSAPWVALGFVVMWSAILNIVTQQVANRGEQTFCYLLILCDLIIAAKLVKPLQKGRSPKVANAVICIAALIAFLPVFYHTVPAFFSTYHHPPQSDVGLNTFTAGQHQFDLKENPYSTKCQLWQDPSRSPHVTQVGKQLYMYGIPYYYGYPYFPAMFLTYEPLRRIEPTIASIRLGNGICYLATMIALAWLASLLVPPGRRAVAAVLAVAALACTWILGQQYFLEGTTDVIIPMFALFGFIAAYYKHPSLAGILFGWAFACKLLPGGMFCLIMLFWYWRQTDRWKFILPMAATFLAVMVPYILMNPQAFLSATVLFYLTDAQGDDTAMYFFVPENLRPAFLLVGYAVVAAFLIRTMLRKHLSLVGAVASCFIGFVLFIAFSKMDHPNYFLAVAPLGCLALVVYSLKDSGTPATAENSQLEANVADLSPIQAPA